jgi:hypothetical protein
VEERKFEGFEQSNTTPVPDVLFDELLSELSGTELKVLLYIMRRTAGFKKTTDAISLSQFQYGITTKDGRQLDKGCGVSDRKAIIKALKSLEEKKCITSEKAKTDDGDYATTVYRIFFSPRVVANSHQGSGKNLPRVVDKSTLPTSGNLPLPVVANSHPQETVIQETVIQETERQEKPTVIQETQTLPQPDASPSLSQKNEEETKPLEVDYPLFDRLCQEKGYAPDFKVPRNERNNAALQELRSQCATVEQVEFVFNDLWNDKDQFWQQHRGKPSTVASQFTARVWKMTAPAQKRQTWTGAPNYTEDRIGKPAQEAQPTPVLHIVKPAPQPTYGTKLDQTPTYTRLKIEKPARGRTLETRLQQKKDN